MKTQTLPDGSLVIEESFRFLRVASVMCACLAGLLFVLMVGGGFGEISKVGWAALGIAVLCLAGTVVNDRSFRFDATSKMVSWRQRNLFRTKHGQLPFSDINDVVVAGERGRDDDTTVGGYTVRYRATLVTANGNIPLSSYHSRREQDFRDLADKVLEVLAIPEASRTEDEAARLVAAGRIVDAVSKIRERDGSDLNAAQAAVHKIQRDNERH